mgnify:CR=1 FL=1|jgi:hypothetical protein
MTTNSVENIVKLAACICAQDGIISQTELDFMQKNVQVFNKIVDEKDFNSLIDAYFQEDKTVLDYCSKIDTSLDIDKVLQFCLESASSDELDPEENKAYQQARSYLKKE